MLMLVSALFDLSKRNPTPRRTIDWLLDNGRPVLELPYPMVMFIEKDLIDKVQRLRKYETRFVPMDYDDLPHIASWKAAGLHLVENRDPAREDADLLFLLYEKLWLTKEAIKGVPFSNITHAGWINLGLQNVKAFDSVGWEDAFDVTDKVRLHQQRYLNRAMVDDSTWYKHARCATAGGFIVGGVNNMLTFIDDYYGELQAGAVSKGLAPLDEEVFARMLVYDPNRFTVSYGDYGQMLCNAKRPRWGGGTFNWAYNRSLYWMIIQALRAGDWYWANNLWSLIMKSRNDGYFVDDVSPLEQLRPVFEG